MNRLLTTIVQLGLLAVALPMLKITIKELIELMKEEM